MANENKDKNTIVDRFLKGWDKQPEKPDMEKPAEVDGGGEERKQRIIDSFLKRRK